MESENFPTDAELIAWRRHFHEHPELSCAEVQTAAYIEAQLRAMGIRDIQAPTPTSRVADIVLSLTVKNCERPFPARALACYSTVRKLL